MYILLKGQSYAINILEIKNCPQEPDDSSTAALIQTGGCSNPESLCESTPSSR